MWYPLKWLTRLSRFFYRRGRQSDQLLLVSKQFNLSEAKKKMSKTSRLRTEFKVAVDHVKDRVIANIVEAKMQGIYKIDDNDAQKLIRVIESSFEQGFINASGQIEKSIEEVVR